ncbi:MAG: roadblock/LC7 domain-containing protein [Acidobacteria bacterium]|nr:roadblock/LC7 domain-containing protein [Acidobacteriota bacterium]
MEISNFRLRSEEYEKIRLVLGAVQQRIGANWVFLINRNGQEIAHLGNPDVDIQALSSLAASNLAATFGLAAIFGENEFQRIYHRGRKHSILINPVGNTALLLMVFPSRNQSSVDLTSLQQAALILNDILSKSAKIQPRKASSGHS